MKTESHLNPLQLFRYIYIYNKSAKLTQHMPVGNNNIFGSSIFQLIELWS